METSFEEDFGTKIKDEPLESETESQSEGVSIKQEGNISDFIPEVDVSRINSDIGLTSSPAVKLLDK